MELCVSRETRQRLTAHLELLARWNSRINLVAPATIRLARRRHLKDSAQLLALAPTGWGSWIDLGSGSGFPGLVVAILSPGRSVILVESDRRKAEFLRQAARVTGTTVEILAERAETARLEAPDVLSARALAPLPRLLGLVQPFLGPQTVGLFPKGGGWRQEIAAARRSWRFSCEPIPSRTEAEAAVLRITDVAPA